MTSATVLESQPRPNLLARARTRIVLIDDHPLIRRGLADLIGQEPDLEVCGEAMDPAAAMQLILQFQPQVVIVDLTLKSGSGIELIKQIRLHDKQIKVLVVSMQDEDLFAERVLRAGAVGFVGKQEAAEKVVTAIRRVLDGDIYLSDRTTHRILHFGPGKDSLSKDPIQTFSNRELEVFEKIGLGLTTKAIARLLNLSPKTIETHREKLKAKLNVASSSELSRRAVQWTLERA